MRRWKLHLILSYTNRKKVTVSFEWQYGIFSLKSHVKFQNKESCETEILKKRKKKKNNVAYERELVFKSKVNL